MKINSIILFIFAVILTISCNQKKDTPINLNDNYPELAEDEEPPLIFEVISENSEQNFVENQPKKWEGIDKDSIITIKVYDWKLFPHNHIEFEYPRTFSFEATLSKEQNIYVLSGNDFKILSIRSQDDLSLNDYAEGMILQFGASNCSKKQITKKLNNSDLEGIKLNINLAGNQLELEILEITDQQGIKSLLILQDALNDDNKMSDEAKMAMKRINQTFKIK